MKKRKRLTPLMLFWNKRDQLRFIETVEKLSRLVNDLETVLTPAKRRAQLRDAKAALAGDGQGDPRKAVK